MVLFSPDDGQVLSVSGENHASVRKAPDGERLFRLDHNDLVLIARYSSDGRLMVSASADGTARIWNATNGQPVTAPLRHDGAVHWAEFSPDGRRLVTATADQSARIWNTDEGRLKHTLANHDSKVFRAHFSPDGERIATITERGSIGLWEAESGKLRFELNEHGTRVNAFALSPDGRRFVAAGSHGTAWVWNSADAPTTVIAIEGGRLAGNYLGVDNVSVVADDSTPSPAPANLIVNGSFETFDCPGGFAPDGSGVMSLPPGATVIPGWTTTTHELAWVMNVNALGLRQPMARCSWI